MRKLLYRTQQEKMYVIDIRNWFPERTEAMFGTWKFTQKTANAIPEDNKIQQVELNNIIVSSSR